jgi:hypothetical protein
LISFIKSSFLPRITGRRIYFRFPHSYHFLDWKRSLKSGNGGIPKSGNKKFPGFFEKRREIEVFVKQAIDNYKKL